MFKLTLRHTQAKIVTTTGTVKMITEASTNGRSRKAQKRRKRLVEPAIPRNTRNNLKSDGPKKFSS